MTPLNTAPLTLGDLARTLRQMRADPDWQSACPDRAALDALLQRLDGESAAADEPTPDLWLQQAAAYNDFDRYRRRLSARLNLPDHAPLRVAPEQWLRDRMRQREGLEAMPFDPHEPRSRLPTGRFRIS
ncbi:hypothetical protein [Oleiagrimonas sp. C23AA]|uniref:hypothetical protein n=1 Tax=Oleiagrimonas sp. C23AA TaxID=2719047 RepID=UPI0014224B11|nr:hypothetical protein [Oleiagrimonas sp. C23AA]NII12340.1 hypothetical protein [Oleiagrimonas sp. C23AA]